MCRSSFSPSTSFSFASSCLPPDFRRLGDFFLFNRSVQPAAAASLFRSRRAIRIALAAQIVFGLWLIAVNLYGVRQGWKNYGPGAPESPLRGIWNVAQFTLNGQSRPPLLTDGDRWRRVVFDYTDLMVLDRMNDARSYFNATVDPAKHTLALSSKTNGKSSFTWSRPTSDQLLLDGTLDGHPAHIQLQRVDAQKFQLVSRGFHWIQEYPFNR